MKRSRHILGFTVITLITVILVLGVVGVATADTPALTPIPGMHDGSERQRPIDPRRVVIIGLIGHEGLGGPVTRIDETVAARCWLLSGDGEELNWINVARAAKKDPAALAGRAGPVALVQQLAGQYPKRDVAIVDATVPGGMIGDWSKDDHAFGTFFERLRRADRQGEIVGLVAMLARHEAADRAAAAGYAEAISGWVRAARKAVGDAALPIALGEPDDQLGGKARFLSELRRQQLLVGMKVRAVEEIDLSGVRFDSEGVLTSTGATTWAGRVGKMFLEKRWLTRKRSRDRGARAGESEQKPSKSAVDSADSVSAMHRRMVRQNRMVAGSHLPEPAAADVSAEVDAVLTHVSPPLRKQALPGGAALVYCEYKVRRVIRGKVPGDKLLVIVHSLYENREVRPITEGEPGHVHRLKLGDWTERETLQDVPASDTTRTLVEPLYAWTVERHGRPADDPPGVRQGLEYALYHGYWHRLPNFAIKDAVKRGVTPKFDTRARARETNFAMRFEGFIEVPTDGEFTFYTRSDDGTKLWIGRKLVVDNDGHHGTAEKSGKIQLQKGKHAIRVDFMQGAGPHTMVVEYAGPGIKKQEIPQGVLFYRGAGE